MKHLVEFLCLSTVIVSLIDDVASLRAGSWEGTAFVRVLEPRFEVKNDLLPLRTVFFAHDLLKSHLDRRLHLLVPPLCIVQDLLVLPQGVVEVLLIVTNISRSVQASITRGNEGVSTRTVVCIATVLWPNRWHYVGPSSVLIIAHVELSAWLDLLNFDGSSETARVSSDV